MRIISLGGSLISLRQGGYNAQFVADFMSLIAKMVQKGERYTIICGGGALARSMQQAYGNEVDKTDNEWLDRIGIAATRLHANMIGALCSSFARVLINNPPVSTSLEGGTIEIADSVDITVSGGWILGVSTDYIAVHFAIQAAAEDVINISDTPYIYAADPRLNPAAKPLHNLSWQQLADIVGEQWRPGRHIPFDPHAITLAKKHALRTLFVGADIANLQAALSRQATKGTVVEK